MALDFTLLTGEQIWGDDALEVMKRYGTKVAPTDLTVILGGYMTGGDDRTSEGDLTCASWSASSSDHDYVRCVYCKGDECWNSSYLRRISARPALPPSEASKISPSIAGVLSGIRVAEYGEYPQTVADDETCEKLERLHSSRSLRPTGKNYTFDSVGLTDYDTAFKPTSFSEYEMDGKKYIRVLGQPFDDDSRLSGGEQVEEEKPYWVQVQPIEWLQDPSGYWVSKKCLFSGFQFDTNERYNGDFKNTFMKKYLDTYFAKEIEPSELQADKERKARLEGLKAKLTEASDLTKARADTKPARTPERTEIAARMKRVRRERDVIRAAADEARLHGDEKLFQEISEIAKPSMARARAVMDKYYARKAARSAARAKKDRE